jgi:membrane-bound metal-dependent hydrolase YbcI (DUF457 family)
MATPIVHAGLGIIAVSIPLLYRSDRDLRSTIGLLALGAIGACLPDADLLVSYVLTGDVRTYHFGVSHSYFFAILIAGFAALKFGWSGFAWAFLLVGSHVVVDSLTGPLLGASDSVGIRSMWPLTDSVFHSPLTLFLGVDHNDWLSSRNLRVVVHDLLLFGLPASICAILVLYRAWARVRRDY